MSKAGIVIFTIGSTLVFIVWSAYFKYIVRQSMQSSKKAAEK